MESGFVVDGNLLTRSNIAQRNEEDVTVKYLHVAVRFAGMVDIMRAVPSLAPIKTPALINRADTQSSPACSPISFGVRYFFASVFRYLQTTPKGSSRKTTLAFNWRVVDLESWIQVQPHVSRLQARRHLNIGMMQLYDLFRNEMAATAGIS